MSKEEQAVEITEKPKMDPGYILSLTFRLCLTCLVVSFLLGMVNKVTLPNITAAEKADTEAAMMAVVPEDGGEITFSDSMDLAGDLTDAASSQGGKLVEMYQVYEDGADAGYTLKVSASGSQGTIVMMVGVDAEDTVTGVSIVSNSETPGIGSRVMDNEPTASGENVLDQFAGKSTSDTPLAVGSNVDAISGATVSSRGVTTGVNAALAVAGILD